MNSVVLLCKIILVGLIVTYVAGITIFMGLVVFRLFMCTIYRPEKNIQTENT